MITWQQMFNARSNEALICFITFPNGMKVPRLLETYANFKRNRHQTSELLRDVSASFPKSPSTNIVATLQLDIWASKVYILYIL